MESCGAAGFSSAPGSGKHCHAGSQHGKQGDRWAQGGNGGCHQRDFQRWENIWGGLLGQGHGVMPLCVAGMHGKKGSPSSSYVFSGNRRMGERGSGREEGKCCSSPSPLPKETPASLLPPCPAWEEAERRSRLGTKGFMAAPTAQGKKSKGGRRSKDRCVPKTLPLQLFSTDAAACAAPLPLQQAPLPVTAGN